MTSSENPNKTSAIIEAIRAKREHKSSSVSDIASLEASLLADIESFDLNAAERRARREENANSGAGMIDPSLVFPEIVPNSPPRVPTAANTTAQKDGKDFTLSGSSLLNQLRQQAEIRQHELHVAMAERTTASEAIDQALKHLFFYLHDFVQQLNIVKPGIPRSYPLIEKFEFNQLAWQEGFADYRTQSQSAGALVELVTFTYRLSGPGLIFVDRDGPAVDRFRTLVFDYGLPFTCKEIKNARSYVERAEFQIHSELSVSARWRADFENEMLILETRNLERLGSLIYRVRPHCVDQALLDDFGRLVLGQPNRFRELIRR